MTGAPKLRVLVVEDEWAARNYLLELLDRSDLAEIVGAVADLTNAHEALDAIRRGLAVDVVFVDVQLAGDGEEAGLELVRARAAAPDAPAFVLATASSRHALHAFDLGVVDYLRKPFTQLRVNQALERIRARRPLVREVQAAARIVARRKRSLVFLRPEEVWAFGAAERMVSVHTRYGAFEIDLSLTTVESTVGRGFLRVHRNWLVNADHVREMVRDAGEHALVVGDLASRGGSGDELQLRVPVGRERAQSVREVLLANATGIRKG
jgi:DNA-binding LytR/AlgR family response regulator